jgi:hypothetical protein
MLLNRMLLNRMIRTTNGPRATYTRAMRKSKKLIRLLAEAKRLAKRYYDLTKRPLGVTGEVAEYEAIRLMHLRPAAVREPGYDAEGKVRNGRREQLQIKGRCFPGKINPGARMGAIDLSKPWDAVLLVILDSDFDAFAIYRAERAAVRNALLAPGSKARNKRRQLSISKFKAIGHRVWPRAGRSTSAP